MTSLLTDPGVSLISASDRPCPLSVVDIEDILAGPGQGAALEQ